jgi:ATP-dependent helicase/nuclease subunit A
VRTLATETRVGIQEGKIDLLFEESEGCVLVDYKTDECPAGTDEVSYFREKHGEQIVQYARALASLGVKVKSAYLLLARTGHAVQIPIV